MTYRKKFPIMYNMNITYEHYEKIQKASSILREENDCSVIALAVASGKSYEEVHSLFTYFGRLNGKGVKLDTIKNVAHQLHLRLDPILVKNTTTNQFIKWIACKRNEKYLLLTRGHIATVVNGTLMDWRKQNSRARVWNAWKISNIEA